MGLWTLGSWLALCSAATPIGCDSTSRSEPTISYPQLPRPSSASGNAHQVYAMPMKLHRACTGRAKHPMHVCQYCLSPFYSGEGENTSTAWQAVQTHRLGQCCQGIPGIPHAISFMACCTLCSRVVQIGPPA